MPNFTVTFVDILRNSRNWRLLFDNRNQDIATLSLSAAMLILNTCILYFYSSEKFLRISFKIFAWKSDLLITYERLQCFNRKLRSNDQTLSHFITDLFPWNFRTTVLGTLDCYARYSYMFVGLYISIFCKCFLRGVVRERRQNLLIFLKHLSVGYKLKNKESMF